MKRLIIYLFALLLPLFSTAQLYHSIEIDANSFKPVNTDALTGVAIDKIEVDNSLRPCARIKLKVNRMTRADIENLQIKVMGGIHDVMKRVVAHEGNGLIIELTAKPQTRFYLHHDKYGDSNEVTLNLEGNKEYRLDAELCHMYSIVVSANLVGADVYVDNTYKGKIDSNHTLTISNIMAGSHNLRVEHGNLKSSQEIFVSDTNIHFRSDIKEEEPHYVVIEVSPKDAIVKINGKEYIPESGVVVTSLHNGTYSYSVSANNHHSESGTFVVNCKGIEEKFEKHIELNPAYGWLQVSNFGALQDASVYVDGALVGTTPISKHQLPSGTHTVRITKRLYKSHEAKVVISDNQTKEYAPTLVADFATVTLTADKGCKIYVNNSYKGTTLWSGDLPTGTYIFEARKESHRSATLSKTITAEPRTQSYTIPSPKPIYGSLNVNTSPAIADVYVDSKLVGRTPLIHNLIIGNHTISVRKEGFDALQQSITITEGQRANLNLTLVEAKRQSTISYTTKYNSKVTLKQEAFDAKVISHTYENGVGTILFEKQITKIGDWAFDSCNDITSITIPNSVTSIGKGAFWDCDGITSVIIPNSVTSIGNGAFASCSKLKEFKGKFASPDGRCLIVDGVLNSFAPSGLTSYIIPNSVTSIGEEVFCCCGGLISITIPNSVTSIGEDAFSLCNGLTSITIPNSVTSIGNSAFWDCDGLTSITIPNSVTSIGDSAFYSCDGLTSITIPSSVTSIGNGAFASCSKLKEFKGKFASPDGRCLIVDGVLNSFAPSGLTTYTIPNSVTSIGEWAFAHCSGLISITIPNSVTSIGGGAFYSCDDLTSVYCKATTPPTLGNSYVFDYNSSSRKIYVPTASVSAYKSAYGWSEYASSIVGYDFDGNPTYTETISGLNMKMVYVEGGSFQMGATSEQSGKAESDEHPAHAVKIDPYYIAECEVTQAQWRKIMGYNPSQFTGNENHPVENVSWDEAAQFCRKLSQLTGKKYLLPTEAQWEYAARGGNQSQGYKYSGSNSPQYIAWYDSNSSSESRAVKQKSPNELGLYDMSGNVLEWCSDWYNEGYYRISAQNNPTGQTSGTHRVLRGGSWRGSEDNCRVSHRRHGSPTTRSSSIGFRVVCLSTNTNQSTTKTTSTAPSAKESTPDYGEAFVRVEQMPSFNGGTLETFRRWVMQNIQKPNSVQGRVFVQFIIERDGSLTNVKVLQSPHTSLSNEALRVIKSSPKWTPGKQRGQAVRVSYTLPIDFR